MGGRSLVCGLILAALPAAGCETTEPSPERIEIAAADRSCNEGEVCGVVETSCRSQGCECGVAVNEASLLDYQKQLAECRGHADLATCDFACPTPFAKCFQGACVLTDEPPELFRRGRSVQTVCERTRGTYVGCPECPPNERCKSCMPCECPSSHRWTAKGCRAVVQTEARDIRVEARPWRVTAADKIKTRIHNDSRRTIWIKTICGTPFYRVRKKEDAWEQRYETFGDRDCTVGSIEIDPGKSRPFVVRDLSKFRGPSGAALSPGTYRFELTYTDGTKSFRHHAVVYSAELELIAKLSSR